MVTGGARIGPSGGGIRHEQPGAFYADQETYVEAETLKPKTLKPYTLEKEEEIALKIYNQAYYCA